ncbi:MAG TPA: sporulation membrane protein YtaF [Negativicutes bacterium]|nr:sporulation membrane protein YtaF [Negativicutes bacterium]
MNFMTALLFAVAISLDGLGAGVAYGLKNIRIPFLSLTVVGAVTAAMMGFATAAAGWLGGLVAPRTAYCTGALLLIALGFWSILQEWLKQYLPEEEALIPGAQIKLDLGFLRLVIQVFKRPVEADVDHSGELCGGEAFVLGLALALDALVAGFAAALTGGIALGTVLAVAAVQMAFIFFGARLAAAALPAELQNKFPYIPGGILILLGLLRFW